MVMFVTVGTSFRATSWAHSLDMDAAYEAAGQRGNWFSDTFLSRRECPALPPRRLSRSAAGAPVIHGARPGFHEHGHFPADSTGEVPVIKIASTAREVRRVCGCCG